jgi:hypothetical protein
MEPLTQLLATLRLTPGKVKRIRHQPQSFNGNRSRVEGDKCTERSSGNSTPIGETRRDQPVPPGKPLVFPTIQLDFG